jgi:putative ABC transport system permease protein
MSPRWQKVWRDLLVNKSRTIVVVLAIAVGVVAFGGVFTTQSLLLHDMASQYKAINPTSLTVTISAGYEPSLLRTIAGRPGVNAVRGSGQTLVRVFTAAGARNMILTALDDYRTNAVNKISVESGSWPPARRELVLERKSAGILPYNLGETIEVENSNGRRKTLTFVGTVHDLRAIPANLFPQLTGYVTFDTFRYLEVPDNLTRIEIQTTPDITTLEQVQTLGNGLKTDLENRGFTGISLTAEKPNKHWGEDVTNAFVTILTIIGSFSLILSVLLVYNTVSATVVQQKKQIGIMKAVGARRPQIFGLFLSGAVGYGLLATLVAIPLGALMAYGNLAFITGFLNLDILSFAIPLPILVLEVAASLGVPVLAAIIPVSLGTRVTVREAISDFVATKQQQVVKIGFLSRPLTVSLRNTFRQKGRLALTLITLTIAGALFVCVIGVRSSMQNESARMLGLYNYDLELFFGGQYDAAKAIADALKVPGVTAAETPLYLTAEWQKKNISLVGLPEKSDFSFPVITAGRWIRDNDVNKIVIASQMLKDYPNLEVGQNLPLKINDQTYPFEIVGIYQQSGEGISDVVSLKYLQSLSPEANISSVRVQTNNHSTAFLADFAKNFEQTMKKQGYNVAYSLTIDTIKSSNQGQFDILVGFLLIMAALVAVVGGLGLAGTMSLNVLERTREIGVMRSIGASNNTVFRLVLAESLFIGWLSWLAAIPISIPAGIGFCYALGLAFFQKPLDFVFSVAGISLWLIIVSVISILASLAPARKAVSLTVRDTLAYE